MHFDVISRHDGNENAQPYRRATNVQALEIEPAQHERDDTRQEYHHNPQGEHLDGPAHRGEADVDLRAFAVDVDRTSVV